MRIQNVNNDFLNCNFNNTYSSNKLSEKFSNQSFGIKIKADKQTFAFLAEYKQGGIFVEGIKKALSYYKNVLGEVNISKNSAFKFYLTGKHPDVQNIIGEPCFYLPGFDNIKNIIEGLKKFEQFKQLKIQCKNLSDSTGIDIDVNYFQNDYAMKPKDIPGIRKVHSKLLQNSIEAFNQSKLSPLDYKLNMLLHSDNSNPEILLLSKKYQYIENGKFCLDHFYPCSIRALSKQMTKSAQHIEDSPITLSYANIETEASLIENKLLELNRRYYYS